MPPHIVKLAQVRHLAWSWLFALPLLLFTQKAAATTCAGATTINPASLPINGQSLVCGAGNDLNSTNVPGNLCGSGNWYDYKDGNEALYQFTPTTTGPYQISYSGQTWSSIQVYIGCPTNNNCVYGSGSSGSTEQVTVALNAGTQYFIWFDTWPSPASPCPGTFSLSLAVAPPNDNPCTATALPVNATCTYTTSTTANATATSGVPAPTCANYAGADVWFSVVVPASGGLIIDSNTGVVTDGGMALYTAPNCSGTFTQVACDDDGSVNGVMPMIQAAGLTPGTTVYVRFWEYGGDNNGTFSICAQSYTPPTPPANDNPCAATVAPVNPDMNCTSQAAGTLVGATPSGLAAAPCFGTPDNDVWFRFTATSTTHYISLNNVAGNTTDLYHAVYSGTCGALTNISCSDPNNSTLTGLTIGQTYWIRVYSYWAFVTGDVTTFNLCITTPPPPPACGQVFYDPGGAGANYPNGANSVVTICPSVPGDMVVLNFTSFNTEANYDQLLIYDGNSIAAPLIGTYSGTAIPPLIMATNPTGCLTAVFTSDGSVNYAGWAANVSCLTPPAGDCVYVLRLNDSGGNGWGSSAVRVRINGGAWTSYTVTGASNMVLIGVNLGDLIELEYIATGPNQNQNSYSISKLGQFPYFSSVSPPAAGITFSQTVDCGPPPAQPQDCAGGVTLCSSQSITTTQTNSGQLADLNPSNQGCLSGGESMGTWYFFSPQTSGTIGFTITPANGTDDYDFALWGPYTEATCPTQPPLRCSWNAPPSYEVGLGNGATDLSEGAAGDGWVKTIDALAGEVYVLYVDNWSTSGQAFTLSWQLSGGSSLDCTTLPVELLSLEAFARDPAIDVQWTTATEQHSSHFNVQRSADNLHFSTIGTLAAAGNSQFRTDYLFVDQHPLRGVNYYRLEQVDIDATTMITHTVVATLGHGDGRPQLFPNPATDLLNVVFAPALDGTHAFSVVDAVGRVVTETSSELQHGQASMAIPLDALANGWYNLLITQPDGTVVRGEGFLKQ